MRNACREKYQFVRFFHFIEMLSKSFFKFTLSLANILHTTTFFTTCKNINTRNRHIHVQRAAWQMKVPGK